MMRMESTILIVGALIIAVSLTTGCLFIFEEEEEDEDDTVSFTVVIDSSEDQLEVTVIAGTIDWDDYIVEVDGVELTTDPGSVSGSGDVETFTDPAGEWDADPGEVYDVEITDLDENVIYDSATIAI